MKRKLLNGVMLLAALTAVGTLSSCKDYDSEQLMQQQYNGSFSQKLDALQTQLDALEKAHNMYEKATDARLDALEAEIKDKLTEADLTDYVTEGDLQKAIDDLREELTKNPTTPGGCECDPAKVEEIVTKLFNDKFTPEIKQWIAEAIGTAIQDIATLQSQVGQLEVNVLDLKGDIYKINKRIDELVASGITRDEVLEMISNVETVFDAKILALQTDINALRYTVNTLKGQLADTNGRLDALSQSLDGISSQVGELNTRLLETDRKAVEALETAELNKAEIEKVQDRLEIMDGILEKLPDQLDDLTAKYKALNLKYYELENSLDELLGNVYDKETIDGKLGDLKTELGEMIDQALEGVVDKETFTELETKFNDLVKRVTTIESELNSIKGELLRINGLENRLNSLITSVIVQGVYNPIFGTFSTPIGIQSNMLLGYYGRFDGSYAQFPTRDRTRAYNNEDPFTQEEYDAISTVYNFNDAEEFTNGQYITTGKMGKVFMTLNPSNVDLSGATLTLERSNGVASQTRLTNLVSSDAELHFGASRAAGNGFYQADVEFDPTSAAISSMKYEITPGFKSALKDALKEHTKGDIFKLMRKVYDQLNMNIPAYGLKAGWTYDEYVTDPVTGEIKTVKKNAATFSKYEIATVLFSPLSYSTYYGQSVGKHLPTHSPIDDALLQINQEKFKFHLNLKIDIKPVEADFEFDEVRFNYESKDFEIDLSGLTFTLDDGSTITFGQNETVKLNPKGIDDFLKNLEAEIDRATHKFTDDMDHEFRRVMNNLVDQVNDNVNKAMKDLDKQINDKITDLLDDIQGKINDKAGKVIDFVNKFINKWNDAADRINGWLDDPNHLLQPTLIYLTNDGQYNRMSTHFDYPSTFVQAGGDGVELFASSNTLEVLAPAYKKFVAIAGEWNPDGVRTSDLSVYKELNDSKYMATVIPGEQIRIALPTGKMKKGYKYEVIYSAIDYRGWISTQRFYVRIK